MTKKKDFNLCLDCFSLLESKALPLLDMIEDIFETYEKFQKPVMIIVESASYDILEYLEENFYIVTTEFPFPINNRFDCILVKPLGKFNIDQEPCFGCSLKPE